MIKQLTQIETVIEDKVYHFVCDPNSSFPQAKAAIEQLMKIICQIEEQVIAAQKAQEPKPTE